MNCWKTGSPLGGGNRCSASLRWSRPVHYDVVEARYVGGYVLWLRFRDDTSGEIDLEKELYGPMFEPLRDLVVLKQFQIHPEFHTVTWSNGADLAPEFLHDNVRVTA